MKNKDKIERAATRAVEEYIDSFDKMEPIIFTNDKNRIWDGVINVFNDEKQTNIFARVPLQVKGTSRTKNNYYRIKRKYIEGYKADIGCVFFWVHEDVNRIPIKILYAILSMKDIEILLQQTTKTIRLDLNKLPKNTLDFEKEIFEFARKRNGEKLDNPATKEIESLVKRFEEVEEHLNEIEDVSARLDLKPLLKIIKEIKEDGKLQDEGTIGWRDDFMYYSKKAIELAIKNIRNYDFSDLQFEFGAYLHKQKLYHLAEAYYEESLKAFREHAKDNPAAYLDDVARTLNNLAALHYSLNRLVEAEGEYKEALEIRRKLAKDNPAAYMGYVAHILNNLAALHSKLNRPGEAEAEYTEALEIYRKLAKDNPAAYMGYVATIFNNLAALHSKLNRPAEAEAEYQEALEIYRGQVMNNPAAYTDYVATTLNNLGLLHKDLNRPIEAEGEYKEALEIRRKLAKDNPAAYMGDVATTLHNLAILHDDLNRPIEAEGEYKEALEIWRKLAKDNPNAYMDIVSMTLNKLSNRYLKNVRLENAEKVYKVALKIWRKLTKDNSTAFFVDVANSLNSLAYLYASQKDFAKAIEIINQAITLMPEDADYSDSKGEILLMMGDEQGALAMWRKVMELDPDFLSKHKGETELHRQLKEKGLVDE